MKTKIFFKIIFIFLQSISLYFVGNITLEHTFNTDTFTFVEWLSIVLLIKILSMRIYGDEDFSYDEDKCFIEHGIDFAISSLVLLVLSLIVIGCHYNYVFQ